MSKHTPGPWQVGCKISSTGVWTPDGTLVALTHSSTRNYKRDEQIAEQNANALLIAAAPDLLEALQYAHDFLAANGWEGDPRMKRIIAALDKAEGRT